MNYPDFKYVEAAINGANNRNHVGNISALKDLTGRKECYMTYFRYNEEMIDHFREKKSVGGYKGQAYADWLPIDIDSPDLQEAQDNLKRLVQNLEDYEIDTNTCRFYFSGSKGFHVMIPSQLFGAAPSLDIHKRFRNVALTLARGINIDTAIYDKTRIFRLPNTINGKSGLYKIELYDFQAMTMPIKDILEMSNQPGEKLDIEAEYDLNEDLKAIFEAPLDQGSKRRDGKVEGARAKLCVQQLMQGVGQGQRDNVGIRVAAHLKQSGLTKRMMWAALEEWNDSNDPPLETYELERIYDQGLNHYEFGCHDHILKAHCNKDCIFYKQEWGRS